MLKKSQTHEGPRNCAIYIVVDAVSISAFATIRDRLIAKSAQRVSANSQTPATAPGIVCSGLGLQGSGQGEGILWYLSRLGQ